MEPKAHRLPPHVRPIGYAVDITTHPARPDFEGTVEATLDVRQATETIEMHARDLEVSYARITVETSHETHTTPATIELDPAREIATFRLDRRVGPGRAKLSVHFKGRPNASMH